MKLGWTLGVVLAVLAHAAFILFGGLIFGEAKKSRGTVQAVELMGDLERKPDEKKPEEVVEKPTDERPQDETPPDAAEVLRELESPVTDDAPALEAASLSAIEAALGGLGGGGDFAESLTLGSGGRIGGTGKFGSSDGKAIEEAFSLAELDQEPNVLSQVAPERPKQMRGRNVEGVVSIFFFIDATGKVVNPRVESSTHEAFESPALIALRKWKFTPGLRGGKPVQVKKRIQIRFPIPSK